MTKSIHADYLKPTVSGLWAHSHNADDDLMKKFRVDRRTPSGWLGVKSFHEEWEAEVYYSGTIGEHRILNQYNGNEDVTPA